jgi:cytochrome c5
MMTHMKKPMLIAIASLALLSGYGNKSGAIAAPAAAAASSPVTAPDLATGQKIYKSTCSICHKSGLRGAPRLGNKNDWEERLAQGNEILYDRAINGYRGKKGSMPSRGSNTKLSVDEVKAAVDYMVAHAVPSWTMEK